MSIHAWRHTPTVTIKNSQYTQISDKKPINNSNNALKNDGQAVGWVANWVNPKGEIKAIKKEIAKAISSHPTY